MYQRYQMLQFPDVIQMFIVYPKWQQVWSGAALPLKGTLSTSLPLSSLLLKFPWLQFFQNTAVLLQHIWPLWLLKTFSPKYNNAVTEPPLNGLWLVTLTIIVNHTKLFLRQRLSTMAREPGYKNNHSFMTVHASVPKPASNES